MSWIEGFFLFGKRESGGILSLLLYGSDFDGNGVGMEEVSRFLFQKYFKERI